MGSGFFHTVIILEQFASASSTVCQAACVGGAENVSEKLTISGGVESVSQPIIRAFFVSQEVKIKVTSKSSI